MELEQYKAGWKDGAAEAAQVSDFDTDLARVCYNRGYLDGERARILAFRRAPQSLERVLATQDSE